MKKELVPGYQLSGIPDLFHEAFSDCEQHHKALQEEKETAWARTIDLDRGFVPLNPRRAPTVLTTGPSNSVNPIPCSKTALSGHINTSVCTYQFGTNNTFSEDHVISAKGLS